MGAQGQETPITAHRRQACCGVVVRRHTVSMCTTNQKQKQNQLQVVVWWSCSWAHGSYRLLIQQQSMGLCVTHDGRVRQCAEHTSRLTGPTRVGSNFYDKFCARSGSPEPPATNSYGKLLPTHAADVPGLLASFVCSLRHAGTQATDLHNTNFIQGTSGYRKIGAPVIGSFEGKRDLS